MVRMSNAPMICPHKLLLEHRTIREISNKPLPIADLPLIETMKYLDDSSLLMFCRSGLTRGVCNIEEIWKQRLFDLTPEFDVRDKSDKISYREYYFSPQIKFLKFAIIDPSIDRANDAASNDYLETVRFLSKKGVIPGRNGVMRAVMNGHTRIVKYLLPIYPIGLNEVNVASEYGYTDMVKFLCKYGVFPDQYGGANTAAGNGHIEIVEYLMTYGIRPNTTGANMAADNGHINMVRFLIEHKIFPNTTGANMAAARGHMDVICYLIQNGIETDEHGLQLATAHGHINVMKFLRKR